MDSRQAVVLIHGIGEQRPMSTLRGFVDVVWKRNSALHDHPSRDGIWSKPDFVSNSFELRMFTTARNRTGVRTDFFEFYWAHRMPGTKIGHVLGWARELLMRRPATVPDGLKSAYFLLWGVLVLVVACMLLGVIDVGGDGSKSGLVGYAGAAIGALAGGLILNYVGDAARYLRPVPENIQRRHEIREAGISLLTALHDRTDGTGGALYDRIVVVGHSLGSVIAYDILTHLWPRRLQKFKPSEDTPAMDRLATMTGKEDGFQEAQNACLQELRAAGLDWRITDLITLGSPLAHAEILLARNAAEFRQRTRERELPVCPPVRERVAGKKRWSYSPTGSPPYSMPHHAAVFGPTRWTNLYFPASRLLHGDIIGGPLSSLLGSGVIDIAVTTGQRYGWLAHTLYWSWPDRNPEPPPHVAAFLRALRLDEPPMFDDRHPCPACRQPVFKEWPRGWQSHALACPAMESVDRADRKADYRRRFL